MPASLPLWTGVLQAAEEWGCPPWEITGESPPGRVLWFLRRSVYQSEIARGQRDGSKHKKS
ncbi:protein of unknown function [Candidatus Promineifilum breve]|uniref:Uncharacterized protein n=1 Tax=Candidatus Promineifilum breve TaxID=1806508 RepID=A0A161JMM4_9CHLR|nr:protein of unknown function [Candidatus Promineifilum breve]